MSDPLYTQWIRKVNLVVFAGEAGLDLSSFHFKFSTQAADTETPNSCAIRIYNLDQDTVTSIKKEFNLVTLNAGYEGGNYGIVFTGTIIQLKIGRENETDTYVDLLCADGDIPYNQGFCSNSLSAGWTQQQKIDYATKSMNVATNTSGVIVTGLNVPNIRGSVMFNMARATLRETCSTLDASWSIQNGVVTVISQAGYIPGDSIKLNIETGLIGMPEQTDEGVVMKSLLNPAFRVGGTVDLNNVEVIKTEQRNPTATAQTAYNSRAALQSLAAISPDGLYRIFSIEYEGDTRGEAWYCHLICLAMDSTTKQTTDKPS